MYSIYGVDKRNVLFYYLIFKYKQQRCGNYFYFLFVTAKGNDRIMNPFNNSFLLSLSSDIYLFWRNFIKYQFSTGSFYWWAFMVFRAFLNLHVCLFHVFPYWHNPQMWRWLKFWLLQLFVTGKDNFIEFEFDVWPAGRYLRMFCIRQ